MKEIDQNSPRSREPRVAPRRWFMVSVVSSLVVLSTLAICGEVSRPSDLVGRRNLRSVDPGAAPLIVEKLAYVPIYPSPYSGTSAGSAIPAHVTLSPRNVSETVSVSVSRADLYDSDGRRVRALVEAPRDLGPLVEAVMRGYDEGAGVSFTSRGQVVSERIHEDGLLARG